MKRGRIGMIYIMAAAFYMTACGSAIPDMSEEQNAQVVEYAAGLLLKYDENYHSRLVEEPEAEPGEEEPIVQEEETVKETETTPVVDVTQEPETTPVVDVTQEPVEASFGSVEEFYGIDGVSITYNGYELKDMYPDTQESEELYFAMNATRGCKLLVLNFDAANISGGDLNLDMLSRDTKFKVSINGETPKYALTTMLMNDLSSFTGTIAAGASERLVLVSEITEEKANSIQTISLNMRNVSEEGTLSLN